MTAERDAVLLVLAEVLLKLVDRDGAPRPGEHVRRVLAEAALAAPRTARGCPEVLTYTRLTREVNELVRTLDATGPAAGCGNRAQWITPAQAAEVLGLKPDSVRKALRRGRLPGVRSECGWRVQEREVTRWARRSGTFTC